MSYETDVMESLRYAIKREIPSLTRELKNFSNEFGDGSLINALNENTKEQKVANLLRLCEISMRKPEYNLLSSSETIEILKTVKESIVPKEEVKEEPKRKGFFR